jgi:hypothetical protein
VPFYTKGVDDVISSINSHDFMRALKLFSFHFNFVLNHFFFSTSCIIAAHICHTRLPLEKMNKKSCTLGEP